MMPGLSSVATDEVSACLRCSGHLIAGSLTLQQQPFPVEWVMQIVALNGPGGRNVYGWGPEAERSKAQRREVEASRSEVMAMRCTSCGMIELRAATADAQ